jgi:hypothetical protein
VIIGFEKGGINLHESDNSHVEGNDFYENSAYQAWDYGDNNIITDNYWHEWIANDTDDNGILDLPKLINGGDNTDPRPCASPVNPIPSWYNFEPITGPPPETVPTDTSTTTTTTTTETSAITTTIPSITTESNTSGQQTGDSSLLVTIFAAIGVVSILFILIIIVKQKN